MQGSTIDNTKTAMGYQAQEVSAHGHEEHPDLRLLGVIVFLVGEAMIFMGLFSAYLIFRAESTVWPPDGIERELLVPGINTLILITSSFVMNKGTAAIKKNDQAGLKTWYLITALMGIVFLAGQIFEYSNLEFGLTTNVYASSFYVLTGFHGMHVTFGVLLILGVLFRGRKDGHYTSESHFGPEAAEIYWHFVDVIWIVLFLLLYIL